jgi:hypothetical protein
MCHLKITELFTLMRVACEETFHQSQKSFLLQVAHSNSNGTTDYPMTNGGIVLISLTLEATRTIILSMEFFPLMQRSSFQTHVCICASLKDSPVSSAK